MSETRQKFLCDAVATVGGQKLYVTVYRMNDGIEFESGRGDLKHGSPRRQWTPEIIKREIAVVYGARSVEFLPGPKHSDSSRRRLR